MTSAPGAEPRFALSRRWRLVVSLGLVLHLTAVFLPPFAFQTSPVRGLGSPPVEAAMRALRPYIDAIYLHHGYAFFAPDPGPSHLLVAHLEFNDGRPPMQMTLPDAQRDWPRLLYHRHFMLSEHLHAAFAPVDAPGEMRRARQMYEARRAAIESYLQRRFAADRVRLTRVEHRLLVPYEFVQGRKRLADRDTYRELSEETMPEPAP
jgi:hypothetical protein